MAHFMEAEESTHCARAVGETKAAPEGWDPEQHLDCVCPTCLKWWRKLVKPCVKK